MASDQPLEPPKGSKAQLENKKLKLESKKLKLENEKLAHDKRLGTRLVGGVVGCIVPLGSLGVTIVLGILTWRIGILTWRNGSLTLELQKQVADIQRTQLEGQILAKAQSDFQTAVNDASDTSPGVSRKVAGVRSLAVYWNNSVQETPLEKIGEKDNDAEIERKDRFIVARSEQSRIANVLTAVMVEDSAPLYVQRVAAYAIRDAYGADFTQLKPNATATRLLFGHYDKGAKVGDYGTVSNANSDLYFIQTKWKRSLRDKNSSRKFGVLSQCVCNCAGFLAHSYFDSCDLSNVDLGVNGDLTGASLQSCNLNNLKAERANLTDADLTNSTIDGARFSDWTQLGGTIFTKTSGMPTVVRHPCIKTRKQFMNWAHKRSEYFKKISRQHARARSK